MSTRIEESPETFRAQIQEAGLKVTAPRLAVMAALAVNPHADAETVFTMVARELPSTSIQAVYGVLGAFTEAGLVRRIEPAGSSALYERRIDDNHHHLICTSCRSVIDVDCATGEAPCLAPAHTHGFAVAEAEVTFWGLCPQCQTTERPSAASSSTQGE